MTPHVTFAFPKRVRLSNVSYVYRTRSGPPYHHASEAAHEAFRDMKFGVRNSLGFVFDSGAQHESWPFLKLSFAERQAYNHLYETWNPVGFNAERMDEIFSKCGFQMFGIYNETP